MKRIAWIVIIIGMAAVMGCPRKAPHTAEPGPAGPAVAPPPPATTQPRPPELPVGEPSGAIGKLGDAFCKATLKADHEAVADLFVSEFLVRMNQELGQIDAQELQEMIDATRDEIVADMDKSRQTPVTHCEILSTEELDCENMARFLVQTPDEDVTLDSVAAALDFFKVKQCGLLSVRETSNAGVENPGFFVGKVDGEWKILLGLQFY